MSTSRVGGTPVADHAPIDRTPGELTVADLTLVEGVRLRPWRAPSRPLARRQISSTRWLRWVAVVSALAWSLWIAGVGRRTVLNPGGWPLVSKFFRAAVDPDLSRDMLHRTWDGVVVTLAYAALGTALSLAIGLIGGVVIAQSVWARRLTRPRTSPLVTALRGLAVIPRGIHEAVWALLLLAVLGRDPLVAVLAIGLPYGAITAKVYANLIDQSAGRTFGTLRAAGASRLGALAYGTLPATAADMVSYAFYRFECSIRAAVVLGMVGLGGVGFQLSQAFQGLAYRQMWTSIDALIVLGVFAELWSAAVRRRRRGTGRPTMVAAIALVALSWWHLSPSPSRLWSSRTRDLARRWWHESLPPRWPRGGWHALWDATLTTLHMSWLAIVLATLIAAPLALIGERRRRTRAPTPSAKRKRTMMAAVPFMARFVALVLRAIPSTVWVLLVLFVVLPGILPGAIALAIYTAGVLARLYGEGLENADPAPRRVLAAAGSPTIGAFAYGSLPQIAPVWAGYSMYRWEVAAREAAVVGVAGAGGLGRLLGEQTAAINYPAITTTVIALIGVTWFVDMLSSRVRVALT